MNQLPIFVTVKDRKVILVGEGEAADAKRRLIERAGAAIIGADEAGAMLAFVAIEDTVEAATVSAALKQRGYLVNVVDQPSLCDFTTPAIVDRNPVLIAIGTGGASAGLAKALRQRLEVLLPQTLGQLADAMQAARDSIRSKWPENMMRRKAIDAALSEAGILDPMGEGGAEAVETWIGQQDSLRPQGLVSFTLASNDPDDLTIRQARYLGQADHIYHSDSIPVTILNRARADAIRHPRLPSDPLPSGLVVHILLHSATGLAKVAK